MSGAEPGQVQGAVAAVRRGQGGDLALQDCHRWPGYPGVHVAGGALQVSEVGVVEPEVGRAVVRAVPGEQFRGIIELGAGHRSGVGTAAGLVGQGDSRSAGAIGQETFWAVIASSVACRWRAVEL